MLSSPASQIVAGVWQHIACTYDQQKLRIFYNGYERVSTAHTGSLQTNQPNGLCVGMNSPNGDELAGLVDDVRIFSVARSSKEICTAAGATGC